MTARTLTCPDCGAEMHLRGSKYGPFYSCEKYPACEGSHGAHPDGRPLGTPANAATKLARRRAHAAFDALWKGGAMRRGSAYAWLARVFGRPAHIAEMTAEECDRVVAAVAARNTTTTAEEPSR